MIQMFIIKGREGVGERTRRRCPLLKNALNCGFQEATREGLKKGGFDYFTTTPPDHKPTKVCFNAEYHWRKDRGRGGEFPICHRILKEKWI